MPRERRVGALCLLLSALVLAGCFTGKRPHFEEEEPPRSTTASGDANIDAVLRRLDASDQSTFTARLDVLTRFGPVETSVVISQAGPDRRSVTIGDVRYLRDGGDTSTCDLTTGECSDGTDESRTSNLQLNSESFGFGAAARLRQLARQKISSSTPSTMTLADQPATCVEVPVSGGVVKYCALDSGVLALLDDAAHAVTLVSYSPAVDESVFGPG